jgi:predicted lysophospholipase L1 biosynthesis ABC-type transport system permease subunit
MRLLKKAIVMAMRSRRRFIVFTLMYTVLMIWMAYNFESYIVEADRTTKQILMLIISIISTVALSILYAFIIINYRKTEIATMKCIGYTNANIRTIIIGELVWVTTVAFTIILEILVHISAVFVYIAQTIAQIADPTVTIVTVDAPLLSIFPLIITLALFLISQIVGILVMYRKILKLRPIVALRVIK